MDERKVDHLLSRIKAALDDAIEPTYRAHGPMRVRFGGYQDDKGKHRDTLILDSTENSEWVQIESSPSGKNLHVYVSSDKVKVHTRDA